MATTRPLCALFVPYEAAVCVLHARPPRLPADATCHGTTAGSQLSLVWCWTLRVPRTEKPAEFHQLLVQG